MTPQHLVVASRKRFPDLHQLGLGDDPLRPAPIDSPDAVESLRPVFPPDLLDSPIDPFAGLAVEEASVIGDGFGLKANLTKDWAVESRDELKGCGGEGLRGGDGQD